ncbi:sugar isomerase [Tenacibaculum holothuriorum]|uniref:Sugar isomerase n=1 Tax=Tenacibaculum holothuriorum TaxID=1635173 RepID=A0A1Y2PDY4_9FLAO|nr:lipopolysaccharide biosynthesis protein [Tenacibaculum holothuriorum]OSY87888.1 sugar isomerase [Tenacibaculum holothuriorum]
MGIVFKQSFKNTLVIYLGFLIGGINTLFLYTRFLKSDYYGLVSYVLSSSNIIMPLTAFGVQYTIVKFFSSYSNKEQKDKFLSSIIFLPLIIALPLGYFWDYFQDRIIANFPSENKIIENYTIYIYVITICCAYFEVFYSWAKVQMQSVFGNVLKELYNRVAVMILLFAVFLNVITKQEFIIYLSYAYILRALIMMLYAFNLYKPKFSFSLPDNYKEVLNYSFYIILAGSASAIILDIDKVMIPGKEAFKAAAYYTVAVFIGSFIEAPSRAMTQILQPLTSKTINDNNFKEVENLYKKSSINLLLIGGLFFVLVNTNVVELFKIMPEKGYADGVWVVLMISSAKLVSMFLGNNPSIIANSKFYRVALPIGVGSALSVYLLNKLFYNELGFGTDGLALSTLITFMIFALFRLWFVQSKMKINPFTNKTFLMVLVIGVFYVLFNFWNFSVGELYIKDIAIHPIINIALKSVLIVVSYVFIVVKLNISQQFNGVIKKVLGKFRA